MAAVSVELVGIDELISELQGLGLKTQAQVKQAVDLATNDARDASLPLIPVKTGYLLSRQQVWFGDAIGADLIFNELRNDAPYALPVCFGHHTRSGSWVAARDFMTGPMLIGEQSRFNRLNAIYG